MPHVKKTALPASVVGQLSLGMFGWCKVQFRVTSPCSKGEGWFRQPAGARLKPLTFPPSLCYGAASILSPCPRREATKSSVRTLFFLGRIIRYAYDCLLATHIACDHALAW